MVTPLSSGMSSRIVLVMGVVNVTPDSFSDGGEFLAPDKAIAKVRAVSHVCTSRALPSSDVAGWLGRSGQSELD